MIDQLRVRHRIPLCGSMLLHGVMAILPVRRIISPFLTIITAMAARRRSPSLDTVFAPDYRLFQSLGKIHEHGHHADGIHGHKYGEKT